MYRRRLISEPDLIEDQTIEIVAEPVKHLEEENRLHQITVTGCIFARVRAAFCLELLNTFGNDSREFIQVAFREHINRMTDNLRVEFRAFVAKGIAEGSFCYEFKERTVVGTYCGETGHT